MLYRSRLSGLSTESNLGSDFHPYRSFQRHTIQDDEEEKMRLMIAKAVGLSDDEMMPKYRNFSQP